MLLRGALVILLHVPAGAAETPLFERDIVPIFSAHCWKCHGMEARKAGLDLRTPPLVFQGSDKGPVIAKGSAAQSLLFQKVASNAMPPGKELKLKPEQVETLRQWIDGGAQFARSYGEITPAEAGTVTDQDRRWWAFRELGPTGVPAVATNRRIQTPIDAFLLAKLEAQKLGFSPQADKRTLIRRAYLDLSGIPPTQEEVDAFTADRSPGAFKRLVDRLLDTPHFGERWGRHWLDAAGYADVHGIDTNVSIIRTGEGRWRYRDYVVRSFNQDKPYDRFLTEQIAGDEMSDWRAQSKLTPETVERLEATGFLRTAADDTDNNELNIALIRYRVLQLTIQNLTSNVLGLTVACAQCHTHKYDPIPQQDYYRMMAIFQPAYNPQAWPQTKDRWLADVSLAEQKEVDRHNANVDARIKPLRAELSEIRKPQEGRLLDKKLESIPEVLRADTKSALNTPVDKRNEIEKYLVRRMGALLKIGEDEAKAALDGGERARYQEIEARIADLEKSKRRYGQIQALYDVGPPPPSYLMRRGNHETPAAPIEPGFLTVLTKPGRPVTIPAHADGISSGRRLALAQWLTAPDTPASSLAARVFVNRMWQHLFGEGLVNPPDNFGKMGAAPTHPELLEWLAGEFVRQGWRIKPMIRLIMSSAAYQQASHRDSITDAAAIDPQNRLLWRQRLRRLESEAIRDSLLAVSGKLDRTVGGPPVKMDYQPDGMVVISQKDLPAQYRRSVYLFTRRSYNLTMLSVFDQPVMDTNCARRNSSAVVLQSLAMLNDRFVLEQADHLASRLASLDSDPSRVDRAFGLILQRRPTAQEQDWSLTTLRQLKDRFQTNGGSAELARTKALAALCHTLLNTNEFLYVE